MPARSPARAAGVEATDLLDQDARVDRQPELASELRLDRRAADPDERTVDPASVDQLSGIALTVFDGIAKPIPPLPVLAVTGRDRGFTPITRRCR